MKRIALSCSIVSFAFLLCAQTNLYHPEVSTSVFHVKSPPVRDMKVVLPGEIDRTDEPRELENPSLDSRKWHDALRDKAFGSGPLQHIQSRQGARSSSVPFVNIEGMDNLQFTYPADPNGDVGLNYYIQTINSSFSVFDKSGRLVYGPVHNSSLWEGFTGPWTQNFYFGGDPVIKFDHLANRWVMSTFSIDEDENQFFTLVAVSTTSDPLGTYNLYAFQFENLNDYPKLAVWHDAYYVTYRMFRDGQKLGPKLTAIDRDAMIAGEPEARMVEFDYEESLRHEMPYCSDIEGHVLSPDRPNYVLSVVANEENDPPFAALHLYEFKVDWENPGTSSFEFIREMPADEGSVPFGEGVSHPGNLPPIDALSFRLMYPLSYRDFGTHEAIVGCRTLRFPEGEYHKRWYELRRDSADWYIYQSGSYLQDGMERWMGSINMNAKGDIALGYSASNKNSYPSIRYTGRLAGDPLHTMTIREVNAFPGEAPVNNVGSGRNRWGDYSSMSVDPVGDTSFWYTAMYPTHPGSKRGNWSTRILAFTLDDKLSAYAGPDQLICEEDEIITHASAFNYSAVYWTSDGDGVFSNSHSVNTTYTLGPLDKEIGDIRLSLHAVGPENEQIVTDTLVIHNRKDPVAYAGNDTTICLGSVIMLQGEQEYADSIRWETKSLTGGTFTDNSALNTIYIPSPLDQFNGSVTLVLKAYNSSACEPIVKDEIRIELEQCTDIADPANGNWAVDLHPNPVHDEFTVLVQGPLHGELSIALYDQLGKKLFYGSYRSRSNEFKQTFDLRRQASGVYFLYIATDQLKVTRRIIKR